MTDVRIDVKAEDHASGVFDDIATGISIAFGEKLLDLVGGAFTFVTEKLGEFVSAAGEAEEVSALFNSVLAGSPLAPFGAELEDLAQQLQKTTRFEDENILAAETIILRYSEIGKDIFPDVIATSLDLAEVMKTDATGAAQTLGRGLSDIANGSLNVLKRSKILSQELIDQAEKMAKGGDAAGAQALILGELENKIGNVAEMMGNTFKGQMDKFNNTIGNIQESIGAKFLPLLTPLIERFGELAVRYAPLLVDALDKVIAPLQLLVSWVMDTIDFFYLLRENGFAPVRAALLILSGTFARFGLNITPLTKIIQTFCDWLLSAMEIFQLLRRNGFEPVEIGLLLLQNAFRSLGLNTNPIILKLQSLFDKIAAWWAQYGPDITAKARELFGVISEQVQIVAAKLEPFIVEVLGKFDAWFAESGPMINQVIVGIMDAFIALAPAISATWEAIEPILLALVDIMLVQWTNTLKVLTFNWKGAWEGVVTLIKKAQSDISKWLSSITDGIKKTAEDWSDNITNAWTNIVSGVGTALSSLWSSVSGGFENIRLEIVAAVNRWIAAISGIWTTITTNANTALAGLKTSIGTALDGVKEIISGKVTAWQGVISGSLALFQSLGTRILSSIKQGIENYASTFINYLRGLITGVINDLLDSIGLPPIDTPPNSQNVQGGAGTMGGGGFGSPTFAPQPPRGGRGASSASTVYNFGPVTQNFPQKTLGSLYGAQ